MFYYLFTSIIGDIFSHIQLNRHFIVIMEGPGGSMSQVAGSNNSYKPITNTAWVRTQLCKLQKGCTRLTATSDKVYQLLAHGRWFSPGTAASSTTKTGRHDIAEILLKVALKHQKSINQSIIVIMIMITYTCILSCFDVHYFFISFHLVLCDSA